MTKILHVVPSFGLGGMEKIMCAVINAIPAGIEQEILALNGNWDARRWVRKDAVHYIEFSRPKGNLQFFQALYGALKKAAPQILMTYNWGSTDAIWLGRLAGVNHIIHNEHGFNIDEAVSTNWKRNIIRHFVYRISSRVVVVSKYLQQMVESQFALPSTKVPFIPNGIDTDVNKWYFC